jgi:uncharacterized protein YkwD
VRRLILLAGLAAVAAGAAVPSPASALTKAQCTSYINKYQNKNLVGTNELYAIRCLISRQRTNNGLPGLTANTQLGKSASAHALASVAAKSWSLTNGLVSHLDPGTPVPGDPNQLQALANQQSDARIRGAGYCAGGRSFTDGEITYGGAGTGATPKAAITFWMNDPPHRAAVLNPAFQNYGFGIRRGTAFPGQDNATSITYVVDLGGCTP